MGMQSFSLRGYDCATALKHTKELGLKYWESIPNHIPLSTTPKNIAEHKAMLDEASIRLMSYGVLEFDSNESECRKKFRCKSVGHGRDEHFPIRERTRRPSICSTSSCLNTTWPSPFTTTVRRLRYAKIRDACFEAVGITIPRSAPASTWGTICAAMRIPSRPWKFSKTASTACI